MPKVKVGDPVIYVDPVARQFNALVTAVWSETCINVVLVDGDDSKTDSYGRQISRQTSLGYKNEQWPHGNYWMLPGETPIAIQKPLET